MSFLCSLLEAALLSSRDSSLTEQKDEGNRGAALLLDLKQQRVDDAISAISDAQHGGQHSRRHSGRGSSRKGVWKCVGRFLFGCPGVCHPGRVRDHPQDSGRRLFEVSLGFCGMVTPCPDPGDEPHLGPIETADTSFDPGTVTFLLTRRALGDDRNAAKDGIISPAASKIFDNLLQFDEVRVEDVMTPRTVAFMLPSDATIEELLADHEAEAFSRIPSMRGSGRCRRLCSATGGTQGQS